MACAFDAHDALSALAAIARYHQVATDPATLMHQLGLVPSEAISEDDLLRAAKHLGLKARRVNTRAERLGLTLLPALALMKGEGGETSAVVLGQCDGRRVLLQSLLKGALGDAPHAVMCGAGRNLRRILAKLQLLCTRFNLTLHALCLALRRSTGFDHAVGA